MLVFRNKEPVLSPALLVKKLDCGLHCDH